ncbi:MAG: type II toxin-antitoxin system RelE/ParE family toxin [Nanoarchaeota archaeon]|nr:type II toxin-antitoxin system RelE/ParE family toxin [Nanoarchaeota archaeon]MBU1103441.1 type II toxin-antitoxin system RelE/ParE family toxin [Nanoarchaeota archaeon]
MYEIIFEEPAKQFIKRLDTSKQKRILEKIEQLQHNPRLGKPLLGRLSGLKSLRIDDYRVIYTVKEIELIVLVLKVGQRKDVYD